LGAAVELFSQIAMGARNGSRFPFTFLAYFFHSLGDACMAESHVGVTCLSNLLDSKSTSCFSYIKDHFGDDGFYDDDFIGGATGV
jgi:hypothetical protein